ncbi:g6141 [Coccomyxa viridis]|uniref:G6141 protein n=1 Tax=Coccomyxa viridis TaxID=1274662 RepID=A0ABP1G190_9CHLO
MAVEKLGQWRQGLSSMSFPRWPKMTGTLGASKKVKPVPAVDPADSNIEMADFQGMPRCYESGSDCEDLLSSDASVSSSQTCASTPHCGAQPSSKKLLLNSSPPVSDSLLAPSRLSSA